MEGTMATIMIFAGTFAPSSWMLFAGQLLPVSKMRSFPSSAPPMAAMGETILPYLTCVRASPYAQEVVERV